MKKQDVKYVVILAAIFAAFIVVELSAPKPLDWSMTLDKDHKAPFGTYALNQLMPDLFPGGEIRHANMTIYECGQSAEAFSNLFILAQRFHAEGEDIKSLFALAESGKNIFIAANVFTGAFADSLNLFTGFSIQSNVAQSDSATLRLADPRHFDTEEGYDYLLNHVSQYFVSYDTSRTEIAAVNEDDMPVLAHVRWGKGSILVCSAPLVFTNFYLLKNHGFVSNALSYLPPGDVLWTNYYHLGRLEPQTPLRFILSQPPLKWAYYLSIAAIILFVLFEAKRRQRVIPIVKPPANSTLEFVQTVGNLYIKKGNNKNIAEKRILYLLEHIRTTYYLRTDELDEEFYGRLSKKSGKDRQEIESLFTLVRSVKRAASVSNQTLLKLNRAIENFYHH